jgi:hypothetical protein
MNKYINASNSIFFLIGLFVLFNLFFIAPRLISMRLPADDLVANWQTLQYFFSYRLEFMKRGLIGTLFDIFNIQPTLRTIWILSFLASNVVFFLIYSYLRVVFKSLQSSFVWIFIFLFFFTISPATAWNFGLEAGRSDIFNLLIELFAVSIIIFNNKKFHFLIPILLILGVLQHEAFIFMNAPVIIALLFNGFIHKKISALVLISSCVAICGVALTILLYGAIDPLNLESLYMSIYHEPLPIDMPTINIFMVITSSLSTNILLTLETYLTFDMWKNLMIALPLFASYLYLYMKPVKFILLSIEKKVLFISPFLIFPMFILGVDIYRWFSMMLINMLIVSAYFISARIINLSEYKAQGIKIALYIIIFYTFFGALGSNTSFPYIGILIERGVL